MADAAVFFAIASLVSSMTFGYAVSGMTYADLALQQELAGEAAEVLEVFMSCSIGVLMVLGSDPVVVVSEKEQVGDLLSFELDALMAGWSAAVFVEMNEVLRELLEALSPAGTTQNLSVFAPEGSSTVPMWSLGLDGCPSRAAYAASADLPTRACGNVVVTLTLQPALLPELGDV